MTLVLGLQCEAVYKGYCLLPYGHARECRPTHKASTTPKKQSSSVPMGVKGRKRLKLYQVSQRCHYCAKWLQFEDSTLDHIVPRSKGGTFANKNLVIACDKCNRRKADMDLRQFLHRNEA